MRCKSFSLRFQAGSNPSLSAITKDLSIWRGFRLHFFLVVSIVVSMDTKALTPLKVLGRELGGDYEQSTHSELDEVGEDRR